MALCRAMALLVLFCTARGNDFDTLLDWQRNLWLEDPAVLFMLAKSIDTGLGVYAYSGEHSRSPKQTLGFHKPLEFYWRDPRKAGEENLPLQEGREAVDFRTTALGPDRYVLVAAARSLKGVVLTVRQLDNRWVAIMKMNGVPVIVHNWFADINFFPPAVKSVIMHGYPIVDCKIDYSKEETITFREGDSWELTFGEDPACECKPTITCKERGESGSPCAEIMSSLINQKVIPDPTYKQYLNHIPGDFAASQTNYDSFRLINDTCSNLPGLLSPTQATKLINSCLDTFLFALSSGHYDFLREQGIPFIGRGPTVNKVEKDEAARFIEGPRTQLLSCIQTSGYALSLMEQQQNTISDLEHLESRLQQEISILNDSHEAVPEPGLSTEAWRLLAFCTVTSIFFCSLFVCGYCTGKLRLGESRALSRNEVALGTEMQQRP